VRCQFDIPSTLPETHLSTEVRHDLFLAAQEAMSNVLKHSGATEMNLRLALNGKTLEIRITDNGHGLTLDRDQESAAGHVQTLTRTHRQGNGLLNMRRRIENLSGTFTVNSRPGQGTEIIFQVPLPMK
jgi:signal transduction histidine kinase